MSDAPESQGGTMPEPTVAALFVCQGNIFRSATADLSVRRCCQILEDAVIRQQQQDTSSQSTQNEEAKDQTDFGNQADQEGSRQLLALLSTASKYGETIQSSGLVAREGKKIRDDIQERWKHHGFDPSSHTIRRIRQEHLDAARKIIYMGHDNGKILGAIKNARDEEEEASDTKQEKQEKKNLAAAATPSSTLCESSAPPAATTTPDDVVEHISYTVPYDGSTMELAVPVNRAVLFNDAVRSGAEILAQMKAIQRLDQDAKKHEERRLAAGKGNDEETEEEEVKVQETLESLFPRKKRVWADMLVSAFDELLKSPLHPLSSENEINKEGGDEASSVLSPTPSDPKAVLKAIAPDTPVLDLIQRYPDYREKVAESRIYIHDSIDHIVRYAPYCALFVLVSAMTAKCVDEEGLPENVTASNTLCSTSSATTTEAAPAVGDKC